MQMHILPRHPRVSLSLQISREEKSSTSTVYSEPLYVEV